ncbi:uncharacterized protein [Palaemon carinicauda]|uniref:uncharacterized protein n=1 Tax=Palaemon carinicauda TaxID=392227 RepID=UPI0035B60F93
MRKIPSDTTGFSPFEILYGRQVRGPLTILKELWTNSDMSAGETDLYSFALELREKLSDVSDLAVQNMNISSSTYKSYFDLKSSKRRFKADDEVLLLIPEKQGKLQFSWRGPYKIIDKHGPVDYWVNVEDVQKDDLRNLCQKYKHVFSDKPGKTSLQEHNIKIKTTEPFVRKYYPIPAHLTKDFDDEVKSLLDLGIIEQSSSNYSSPALLVKKKEELDICKAYHQIPLTPESRKYTAFSTNLGLMQYVRLPFGLSSACATYIRLMRTDASSTGLGAVLLQYIDGEPYPVAFASKKLLPPETRYAAIERECLAIKDAGYCPTGTDKETLEEGPKVTTCRIFYMSLQ